MENKRRNDDEIKALRRKLNKLEGGNANPEDEEENEDDVNGMKDELDNDKNQIEEDEENENYLVPEVRGAVNGMNDGVLRMIKIRFEFLKWVGR